MNHAAGFQRASPLADWRSVLTETRAYELAASHGRWRTTRFAFQSSSIRFPVQVHSSLERTLDTASKVRRQIGLSEIQAIPVVRSLINRTRR